MLAEQPAFFVSGIYLVASSIGLVYSWAFLGAFDVNVFRYAEISDFLLASLKEPVTWFLTLLAVVLVTFDNVLSLRVQRRGASRFFRWYGTERYRHLNYLGALLVVIVILLAYAKVEERKIRDGEGDVVSVHLADGSVPKQLVMLGTTARFVFLYDHVSERVDIHPHESIMMITKSSPNQEKD